MKYSELGPPPSISTANAPAAVAVAMPTSFVKPTIGVPVPVADEQVPPEQTIPTQEELAAPVAETGAGEGAATAIEPDLELARIEEDAPLEPRLLFLDEPSKSLDPVTAERVRIFLLDYAHAHDMTVLLTTHNMEEAEEICDHIGFINGGLLQFVGTPREFRHSVTVQETGDYLVGLRAANRFMSATRSSATCSDSAVSSKWKSP